MIRQLITRQVYGVGKNWILRLRSRVSQDEQNSASGFAVTITQKNRFLFTKGIDNYVV